MRGDEQPIWLRRLELEYGNVRAALGWSLEWGRVETAARLTVSLYPFWDLHGRYSEGRGLIKQVLAFAAGLPAALRAQVLMGEGTLAFIQGDLEAADNASQEAAALSRQAGDPAGVAHALQFLAFGALFTGENGVAEALLDECLSNARLAGDRWLEAWGLLTDAALSLSRGDYDRAVKVAAEGEAVLGPQGDPECRGWLSIISGSGLWRRGDTLDAIGPLREALEAFVKLKGLWGLSIALLMAASVASARDSVRSVTLLAASERLRLSVGAALLPFLGGWLDAASQQAQTALGADAFTQAWAEGEALPVEAAAGLAARTLAEAAREPSDPPF